MLLRKCWNGKAAAADNGPCLPFHNYLLCWLIKVVLKEMMRLIVWHDPGCCGYLGQFVIRLARGIRVSERIQAGRNTLLIITKFCDFGFVWNSAGIAALSEEPNLLLAS